jgi:5-methylcytosine-specific restriction endonuclease McrA
MTFLFLYIRIKKFMDFLNKKIGKVLVVEKCGEKSTGKSRSLKIYKCVCDCGKETMKSREQLTRNQTPSCEKCARKFRFIDLSNKKFGKLTVLNLFESGDYKLTKWNCICECGNIKSFLTSQLTTGKSKSCGCVYKNKDKTRIDLIGKTFGKLIVIKKSKEQSMWLCKCDCGNEVICRSTSLNSNSTKSCGCLRSEMLSKSNSKFWKGGLDNINRSYRLRHKGEFGTWSKKIRKRDNVCQKCFSKEKLNAHHIFNYDSYPEKGLNVDNGITLCERCHKKFHKKYGKLENNNEQLEKFLKA